MSGHTYTHTHIHTYIHTHRTTTVTLAAHVRRGLIMYAVAMVPGKYAVQYKYMLFYRVGCSQVREIDSQIRLALMLPFSSGYEQW